MTDRTTTEILDREYLEMRARILQLAASSDRIDRAEGDEDPRMEKIMLGLQLLLDDQSDKARRVQELFSREYNESWRSDFGI